MDKSKKEDKYTDCYSCGDPMFEWTLRCRECKEPCCQMCQNIDGLCPDCEEEAEYEDAAYELHTRNVPVK